MSKLRPSLTPGGTYDYCPHGATAYYEVLGAIQCQKGLIHGKLDNHLGEHCALGSYFAAHKNQAFPTEIIDTIASVNDSVPRATPLQRKRFVERWLKWKLSCLGFNFKTPKPQGYKT
jgi:hypothetical protein